MATVKDVSGNASRYKSLDNHRFDITPSDTVALEAPIDAIMVGVAGDVAVKNLDGSETTLSFDVAGGPYFIGQVSHVLSTGTTATGLVGIVNRALR